MWEGGGVPSEFAIHGFHSATLSEKAYEPTAALLTTTMGFHLVGHEHNRFRYAPAHSQGTGAGHLIDVVSANAAPQGRVAVGTIHHIAFRTPDDAQQLEWLSEIGELGYNISPVMDRVYFHSIYYRERGGILFEIATDSPGFAIDEPAERLGEGLQLPPWLETSRPQIEAALPRIDTHHKAVAK
jgi:glyoxalase family protein